MLSSHIRIFKAVAFYISLLDCCKMDILFFSIVLIVPFLF